jgi:hypothetical protein
MSNDAAHYCTKQVMTPVGKEKIMGFLVFSPYIKGDDFSYRE